MANLQVDHDDGDDDDDDDDDHTWYGKTILHFGFCRKKKEHADTPPSEAEHMVCEVRNHQIISFFMMMLMMMTVMNTLNL